MIGAFISGCAGISLSPAEIEFFGSSRPWGLILFKRNCETPDQVKSLTTAFRTAVGRKNAPVLVDQEGGRVQRLGPPSNSWRKYPAARRYGGLYDRNAVDALRATRQTGRLMAKDLMEAGINANCIPVLDVPQPESHEIVGDRAYNFAVERVICLARAHVAGMTDGGVLPVMKHIPGHGRAMADSHLDLPIVEASRQELENTDFVPFAAFADLPMAMTAHVVYTALDPRNPATLSKKIIGRIVRKSLGFRGLLMTDDLSMKALSGTFAEKVGRALEAGCDIVLHCNGNLDEMKEVAVAAGELKGKPLARAKAALKSARKPQRFDEKAALRDLDLVLQA